MKTRSGRSVAALFVAAAVVGCVVALGYLTWVVMRPAPTPAPSLPDPEHAGGDVAPRPLAPRLRADADSTEQVYVRVIALSAGHDRVTRAKANVEAERLLAQLERGEDWDELSRAHSVHPLAEQGGQLPRMALALLPAAVRDRVAPLHAGERAIVEHEDQLLIVERRPLPETLAAAQIVVRWSQAPDAEGQEGGRSRAAAESRAREALERALVPGADFEALVGEYSEDPTAWNRGIVGPFAAETMTVPGYTEALLGVEIGAVVPQLIEDEGRFFVLRRIALEETEPLVPGAGLEPPEPAAPIDPARVPLEGRVAVAGERATGAFLLVTHAGAHRANLRIVRTREEALERAHALTRLARSEGQDFRELVQTFSEDRGLQQNAGSTGVFTPERVPLPGLETMFTLDPGQVSDPVETPIGFLVLLREPLDEVALRDIVVTYRGARNASDNLSRSREDAHEIITAAYARLEAGESFTSVAGEVSDQRRTSGGAVGLLVRHSPFFANYQGYEERAFALAIGEFSEIFETEWGFHVILRESPLRARHLRIAWQGLAVVTPASFARTREDADTLAADLLERVRGGADLEALAREHSDDPDGRQGGDTGVFGPGQRPRVFCEAVAALEPGEIGPLVETTLGLEIIQRLPLD